MSESEIRERIAESGKMKIRDVVDYFNHRWAGEFNMRVLKENAKEMIKEAKKYM